MSPEFLVVELEGHLEAVSVPLTGGQHGHPPGGQLGLYLLQEQDQEQEQGQEQDQEQGQKQEQKQVANMVTLLEASSDSISWIYFNLVSYGS